MPLSTSFPLPVYQRSARSLRAKSAATDLALGAAGLATLLAPPAHAQAVAVHPTTGNVSSVGNALYIDFETFSISHTNAPYFGAKFSIGNIDYDDRFFSQIVSLGIASLYSDGANFVQKLAGSVPVNSTAFGSASSAYFNGFYGDVRPEWADVTGGFIGIKFQTSDTQYHYGWLQVNTNSDATEITLTGFGYNLTPGAEILTGEGVAPSAVPEPATSATLLAAGAAGLAAYRRRKNLVRAA